MIPYRLALAAALIRLVNRGELSFSQAKTIFRDEFQNIGINPIDDERMCQA